MTLFTLRNAAIYLGAFFSLGHAARSHAAPPLPVPSSIAVEGPLPALPAEVTDLKFRELFTLPIGPRGLTPSAKLIALAGKRVRMVGYMAKQETPLAGLFILSPLPVLMGDADDSLADDLPASAVFVHVDAAGEAPVPYFSGLLRLTGTLQLGAFDEADGHVSAVRLMLDADLAQAMAAPASHTR